MSIELLETDRPQNSRYRHVKTGGIYEIVAGHASIEATGECCVVYRSLDDNRVWVRPSAEFHDGRFELVLWVHTHEPVIVYRQQPLEQDWEATPPSPAAEPATGTPQPSRPAERP